MIVSERDTPTGPMMVVAHPLAVGDQSCLSCHSEPGAAPASMLKSFGSSNGFGWHLNEVIGAQIISLPLGPVMAQASQSLYLFLALLVGVFLAMLIILNLLLNFLVIRPVSKISAIATDVSMGNVDAEQFGIRGNDEFEDLSHAFNRMRRSLQQAMKMLEGTDEPPPEENPGEEEEFVPTSPQ